MFLETAERDREIQYWLTWSARQSNRIRVRNMSIVKAIILLLFAALPNFAVVSPRLAITKGIKLKGSSFVFRASLRQT